MTVERRRSEYVQTDGRKLDETMNPIEVEISSDCSNCTGFRVDCGLGRFLISE